MKQYLDRVKMESLTEEALSNLTSKAKERKEYFSSGMIHWEARHLAKGRGLREFPRDSDIHVLLEKGLREGRILPPIKFRHGSPNEEKYMFCYRTRKKKEKN